MNAIQEIDDKLRLLGVKPFQRAVLRSLSDGEVGQIETLLGKALPAEYSHFLRAYGETGFSEEVSFAIEPGDGLYEFGYFYGFDSIKDGIESPPDTLPDSMFPIGDEGLGNLYCLGFSGEQTGKVYYWDQNVGWDEEAEAEDKLPPPIRRISNSFAEFISSLTAG